MGTPAGPWTKYAQTDAPAADGPWSKYAQGDTSSAPAPQAPPPGPSLGSSVSDTLSTIGTHLKSAVAGPLQAFTRPASGAAEQASQALGIPGLALYRMALEPTVEAGRQAVEQYKAGNLGLKPGDAPYDAQGNYKPTMLSSAMDALPIVGPWSRNVENDVESKGAVAGMAGLGTDILAPGAAAKGAGAVLRGVSFAGKLATTTPAARTLAATRMLTSGTPGELLQSALKPAVRYGADAGSKLESALPHVLAADPNLQGVSGFARAADAAKDAAAQPYQDIMAPYRQGSRPGSIPGLPIAQAQMQSIPAIDRFESPFRSTSNPSGGIIERTADKASQYQRDIPIPTADDMRMDANAKLNAFYGKAGGDQTAALSSPETARIKAIGDGLRDALYPQLEQNAGLPPGTIPGIQAKYGLLSEASEIANRREPVFARHDPVSLPQKLAAGHGNPAGMAANFFIQKALRGATDSDALVNSAVDRYRNPDATPLLPAPGFLNQIGNAAASSVGRAGKTLRGIPMLTLSGAASPFVSRNNQ